MISSDPAAAHPGHVSQPGAGGMPHTESVHEPLGQWLTRQRWFAGKGRELLELRVSDIGRLGDDPPTVVHAVRVHYADGSTETYQVPASWYRSAEPALAHARVDGWQPPALPTGGVVHDALHDPDAAAHWLAGMSTGRLAEGLSFQREATAMSLPRHERARVLGVEQSNTSVVFGSSVIVKVFRRLVPGQNPEVELLHALAQRGNSNVPALLGWVDGTWTTPQDGSERGTLAIATEFFSGAVEGWELAVEHAHREIGGGSGSFAERARQLGRATASVHRDLAQALPTQRWSGTQRAALAADLVARLRSAEQAAPVLAERADEILARYAAVATATQPLTAQRVHGDLHLGQVVEVDGDWRILDFEGEPARPIAERSALQSPLKDVAGMLRSLDYAGRQALADNLGDPARAEAAMRSWVRDAQQAFCAGYADAGGDALNDGSTLAAFVLDKAVYEVVYETRNRPTWTSIPLAAIADLVEEGTE